VVESDAGRLGGEVERYEEGVCKSWAWPGREFGGQGERQGRITTVQEIEQQPPCGW
jgi:hypothetical protein